ncbi:MAG: T9SS type A sorting domain-containing protein [Bacteroidia bacterium]|nr:T9SS type A sorting domain-containing protein [Bacteroidia bacterium]
MNSYITGFFSDSAFFGNDTLITNGERDIFLTQIIRCAGINGSVSLFSGNLLPEGSTTMYLYEIISSNTSEYIQSIELDGNMEFSFDCIPAGHYIVQAKLINHVEYPGILNTYYGDTHKWPDATIIDINAEDTLNIHIQMIEMLPISNGVGHIYGRIRLADDGLKGTGEPLSGIEVTIEQDPEPIANDVSDEDGQYEFTGVTLGTYTLGVDFAGNDSIIGVPQIQTCTIAVTSTDTLFADINFIVDTSATYHGIYIDTTGSFISFFKLPDLNLLIYPNPFDETVNVDYVLNNTGKVTIDIYDLMGRKLNTIFCEVLPEGHYHQSFLLSPYIPSVYFIKFTYKDYILLKKIVKH